MKAMLAFCLCLAAVPDARFQSPVPRDPPPPALANAQRERDLKAAINSGAATKETYLELSALLNRQGRWAETIEVLKGAAALEPQAAEPHHRVAVLIWDYVRRETNMADDMKRSYLTQAVAAEDRAIAARPDYFEALTYKNILLRMQANLTADPLEQKKLIDDADGLRDRVMAMQRDRQQSGAAQGTTGAPPPPPPSFQGFSETFEQTLARLHPMRIGGTLKMPPKTKDVRPVYPAEAQAARVQGVVIIEAIIGEDGRIENARVLRSIPQLDGAALAAVTQWQFAPSELNGGPIAVIQTVTVNFTLMN